LSQLSEYVSTENPSFTFVLDDPSGNSYIEMFSPNLKEDWSELGTYAIEDTLVMDKYSRTIEQNEILGLKAEHSSIVDVKESDDAEKPVNGKNKIVLNKILDFEFLDIYEFRAACPSCHSECSTRMHPIGTNSSCAKCLIYITI
jgi:hypothetical protein